MGLAPLAEITLDGATPAHGESNSAHDNRRQRMGA